jgi:hypothetical protein
MAAVRISSLQLREVIPSATMKKKWREASNGDERMYCMNVIIMYETEKIK